MGARECADAIRDIVGGNELSTFVAKVKSVNGATCEVVRLYDDMLIPDVRLNETSTANQGLIITPKQDSFVLVTAIDGAEFFVSQFSEIENITLDVNTDIIINGGQNGGIVNINDLVDKLNALVQSFNSHTHDVAVGNAAGTAAATANQASIFNKADFEDTKIKH